MFKCLYCSALCAVVCRNVHLWRSPTCEFAPLIIYSHVNKGKCFARERGYCACSSEKFKEETRDQRNPFIMFLNHQTLSANLVNPITIFALIRTPNSSSHSAVLNPSPSTLKIPLVMRGKSLTSVRCSIPIIAFVRDQSIVRLPSFLPLVPRTSCTRLTVEALVSFFFFLSSAVRPSGPEEEKIREPFLTLASIRLGGGAAKNRPGSSPRWLSATATARMAETETSRR